MTHLERIMVMDDISVRTRQALEKILALSGVSSDKWTAEAIAAELVELDEGLSEDLY
jgi:hypothetical protein